VREGSGIVATPSAVGALLVQLHGTVPVAQLVVKPAEAVQQAQMDHLVADLRGKLDPLAKRGDGGRIVPLPCQREPAQERAVEQRQEEVVFASDSQSLGLELIGGTELTLPVLEESRNRER